MKSSAKPILTLIFCLLAVTGLQAQQSDYKIAENFKSDYAEINRAVETAYKSSVTDSLLQEIQQLDQEYAPHREVINTAIYPDTYKGKISELTRDARSVRHKLLVIENQEDRLKALTTETQSYKKEVVFLNSVTDSLRKEIKESQNSEERLSGLVNKYRSNIEERDEFILQVVDSLLIAYRDLSPEAVNELSEGVEQGKISDEENPLLMISQIIDSNIETLKASDNTFKTEDYLRMYTVQKRFNEAWEQIGDGLVRIYGGDQRSKWVNSVNKRLDDWKGSASFNMWNSMDDHLDRRGLELSAFDNTYSFYVSLDNYVKSETEKHRDEWLQFDGGDKYETFNEFWNGNIKGEWGRYIQEGEILSLKQIARIDSQMVHWRNESEPVSVLVPVLFGISLLSFLGLIIMFIKKN